jgi:thiol-disulfide isomerase/thioredoxin
MKPFGWAFITALALVTGILPIMPAQADAKAVIKEISEPELDAIISAADSSVVVAFVAAWCAPCIDELPTLNRLHKKYKDQGLRLIGLSIDVGSADALQPIVNRLKIEFPFYWYGEKAILKFNLKAVPLLLFIKQGEIVERLPGRRPDAFLEQKFRDFIK